MCRFQRKPILNLVSIPAARYSTFNLRHKLSFVTSWPHVLVSEFNRRTSRTLPWSQGLDVVFYGDSIVESWRGTELGVAVERAKGIPDMWGRHFGEPYNAKAFGIASAH